MHTYKKLQLLWVWLLSSYFSTAQNIVPNGDLEDINICTELNAPCSPAAWFAVKQYVPGGYFHQYPDKAASGHEYFDLFVVMRQAGRQYWQTQLLCHLIPGQQYEASIKIAAGENGPNINDIGFYFTDRFIYSPNDTLLQPPHYIDFLDATIKKLKHNWFRLTKTFTASGEESCLIVGNFNPESNRSILQKRNMGNLINIMIDDIVIKPRNAKVCVDYKLRQDSLYAIRKRHSGDTLLTVTGQKPDTLVNKPATTERLPTIISGKIDTLRLSNVLFDFDKYVLIHPDTIDAFRKVLTDTAVKRIEVVGYTDDAGSAAYNAKLSARRAQEIARLIIERLGVNQAIIQWDGRGISTYYSTRNNNRRVDIYVYY